ncbi:hypothetical protein [Pseudonocardia phyllosphaerae]|uniref:hypothetical protein n=1 Tax=Pseudonocardia phyllosphaerae TaxID=3390502 RepID=UPI003978D8C5
MSDSVSPVCRTRSPSPSWLPERLGLAPGLVVLVRGPGARQLGSGAETARVVENLSPAAVAVLDLLEAGPRPVSELLARAAVPSDAQALTALLTTLLDDGLLTDPDRDARLQRVRASSVVVVRGEGPPAVAVVLGLAASGVGHVHPRVSGTAGTADVVAGLGPQAVGRARDAALREVLAVVAPRVRTGPPTGAAPDLVVPVGTVEVPGTDHLPVTLRDGSGVVGPLVLPGRSPCLRCVDLARTTLDPLWPLVSAQLAADTGTAVPHVVSGTAALVVGQVLATLDGPVTGVPPAVLGASLELSPAGTDVTLRRWSAHPACGCGADRARTAPTYRDTITPCAEPVTGWTIEG